MQRNLTLISVVLAAALISSSAIRPTEAGRGRVRLGGELSAQPEGSPSALAGLFPQMRDKDGQTVSGQIINKRQDPELAKAFRDYDLIRLDPRAAAAQIRNTGKLSISTSEGSFDMQLAPHDMRAPDYLAQVITADGVAHKLPNLPVNTYKGSVKGSATAQVRMAVKESSIEGVIITESGQFFVQPSRSLSKMSRDDEFVFYRGSDVADQGGACGVTLADEVAAEEARSRSHVNAETESAAVPVPGLSPLKIARMATEADAEYVAALGGPAQANAQIMNIMNFVDGIYQVEIGITFQLAFQNAWADASTDPYTSTVPSTLLDQFTGYWNANFTGIQRSLAHLWTGRDLNAGIIGVAFPSAVCRFPESAYGLSQQFPLGSSSISAPTVVLTAHEIAHNFSAVHSDQANQFVPPDVEQPCENTIMEA
ncbi:MAG: zinc-dependent metalloprotease, partial [Pyrinomonadaceae bacterium]|nr:zinc-dependent metalloprotease [Pyrinomonadaceae bacterium]